MPTLAELQAEAARLRADGASARADLLKAKAALDAATGRREEAAAQRAFAAARERFAGSGAALAGAIGIEAFADPRKGIEALPDSHPILLFPLRLETKFGTEAGRPVLRVRIFPDAANVSAHDGALSAAEVEAGRVFWLERARAATLPDPAVREAAVEGAWTALVAHSGAARALFLLARLQPANWPDPSTPPPDPLDFPADAVPETSGATPGAAPRARLLPDRIVVSAYRGQAVPAVIRIGAPIPDHVILGPDPRAVEATLTRDTLERLAPDPALAWMFDYDAAVAAGLAVTLPLEPSWLRDGFSAVTALGVKLSMDAASGGAALADLLDAHRFTAGFDLLANGTPTNNTERVPSGFSSNPQPEVPLFRRAVLGEVARASNDPLTRTDAEHLARGLGLPLARLSALAGATRTDIAEQAAATRALWPATLGDFLAEMVRPALTVAEREAAHDFAVAFVSARGPFPAIRIGRQPYGILPAGSFSRFAFGAEDRSELKFLVELREVLARLLALWRQLAPGVPRVSLDDADHRAFLLTVGQQASSATFLSRKAVSERFAWNWLNYPFARTVGEETWGALNAGRAAALARLGFDGTDPDLRLNSLLWRASAAPLDGPVVDGDPERPLSETAPIAPFDGARNYIHFLATAPRADIEAERFVRADGTHAPVPRALLYKYLRQAVLSQTNRTTLGVLSTSAFPFLAEAEMAPDMANIGPDKHLTVRDLGEVNARRLGLSALDQPVGAVVLDRARAAAALPDAVPAALRPFARQVAALKALADLPTARLERLFAEHMDLTAFRLDAWITALYTRRLAQMRAAKGGDEGLFLGAYGYVEHLRPKPAPETVTPEAVPEELREAGVEVVRRADNGGFIHAPSLTHAVSAAVLRNAFLGAADPSLPGAMAVNLSSARVRAATALLDGLGNGQDLAALVGYLVERALDDHPLRLTLQEAKHRLREFFPFVSNKLTPLPDDSAVEAAEARNVVNGIDLLRFVAGRTYPYGISGLPADPPRAAAITAAVDAANGAFDALGDVLNAEAVHQVVQSNMERARGVVQASGEAGLAPMPDVVATPRSGTSLAQRIAVCLPEGPGWRGVPGATPRAKAAPRLDHWLARHLPPPGEIEMRFSRSGVADAFVSLGTSGLEATDAVLMGAETLGDGSSILERHLVARFRSSAGLDDADTALVFDPAGASPGRFSLADVWPLLSRLRAAVLAARVGDASDFRPASAAPEDRANPRGFDAPAGPLHDQADYAGRVDGTISALDGAVAAVEQILAAPATAARIAALAADPPVFVAADWSADLAALRSGLQALVLFGLPEALPTSLTAVTAEAADGLVRQAASVVAVARARHGEALALRVPPAATPLPADPDAAADATAARIGQRIEALGAALKAAFGGSIVSTVPFAFATSEGVAVTAALATPIADQAATEAGLESAARVRPDLNRLLWIGAFQDFIGKAPPRLVPVQSPARAGDPWIGGPTGTTSLPEGVTSLTLAGPPADASGLQALLVIDAWTELLPTARETTGIAFHFDRPNACAPQALLLAVPPRRSGSWHWEDLSQILLETMEAAKLRAVEPDALLATDLFHALPANAAEFSTFTAARPTLLATNAAKVTGALATTLAGGTP